MAPELALIVTDVSALLQAIRPDYKGLGSHEGGYSSMADLIDIKLYEAYTELLERTPAVAKRDPQAAEQLMSIGQDIKRLFNQFHDGRVDEGQVLELVDEIHRELVNLV